MKRLFLLMILSVTSVLCLNAQTKSLHQLQQEFVDLRCGMFIHFNMPTFFNEDWPDPDAAPELFNPVRMDCKQWAKAADRTESVQKLSLQEEKKNKHDNSGNLTLLLIGGGSVATVLLYRQIQRKRQRNKDSSHYTEA